MLVLAWDDRTSVKVGSLHTAGMLDTHDEETKMFFEGSKVKVHLSMRCGALHYMAELDTVSLCVLCVGHMFRGAAVQDESF